MSTPLEIPGFAPAKPVANPPGFVPAKPVVSAAPRLHEDPLVDAFLRNERKVIPEMKAAPVLPPGVRPPIEAFPQPPPGRVQTVQEKAQLAGISLESAPLTAQILAGLVPEVTEDTAKRILERDLGRPVYTRVGADTGEVEVYDPETQKTYFFDSPGIGLEDLSTFVARDVSQMAAEAGLGGAMGGAAGTRFGPRGALIGAASGAAIGAAGTKVGQLMLGRQLGLHDATDGEILKSAGFDAVTALAGAGAADLVLRAARRYATRALRSLPNRGQDISASELEQAIADSFDAIEEVGIQPSAAGIASAHDLPSAPVLSALEREARSTLGKRPNVLNEQARINRRVMTRRFGELEGQSGADLGARPIDVANEIRSRSLSGLEAAERQASVLSDQSLATLQRDVQSAIGDAADSLDLPLTGRQMRAAIDSGADAARQATNRLYEGTGGVLDIARTELGDTRISALPVLLDAKELDQVFNTTMFSQLDPSRQRMIRRALKGTQSADSDRVFVGTPEGLEITRPRQVSFEDVQRSLSYLREVDREITRGNLPNVNGHVVGKLESSMLNLREQFTSMSPNLATAVRAAEDFSRRTHDQFERSLAGRLVRVRNGEQTTADEHFFETVISPNNVTGSRQVAEAISNPIARVTDEAGLEAAAGAREGMKRGIYELYLRKVLRDGIPNAERHREFMRQYRGTIRPWLSDRELSQIERLGGAEQLLQRQLADHQQIVQMALESPVVRDILGDNPRRASTQRVLSALWNDPSAREQVIGMARNSPELMARVRGIAYQKMRDALRLRPGSNDYDFRTLGPFLDENREAMEALFGKPHVQNLRTLQKAARLVMSEPVASERLTHRAGSLGEYALRATVAPPLTARGRFVTMLSRRGTNKARQALSEALANPALLADLLKKRQLSRSAVPRVLGAVLATHGIEGAGELIREVRARLGPQEPVLQPPGSATFGGPRGREARP